MCKSVNEHLFAVILSRLATTLTATVVFAHSIHGKILMASFPPRQHELI